MRRLQLLLRNEQNDFFNTIEMILNEFADSTFEDLDVVVGLHYHKLSRQSYEISHRPNYERNEFILNWKWIFVISVATALVFTVMAILFIRKDGNRFREVVQVETIEEKDLPYLFPITPIQTIKADDNVITGEVVRSCGAINSSSQMNIYDEDTGQKEQLFSQPNSRLALNNEDQSEDGSDDKNQGDNVVYDFDSIHLISSTNEDDENIVQRRQLLRRYSFPNLEEQSGNFRDEEDLSKTWVNFN